MTQKRGPIVDIAAIVRHNGLRALAVWFTKQVHEKAEALEAQAGTDEAKRKNAYREALFATAKRGAFSPKFLPRWEQLGGPVVRTEDGRLLRNKQIGIFMSVAAQLNASPLVVGDRKQAEQAQKEVTA